MFGLLRSWQKGNLTPIIATIVVALMLASAPADAKPFRWSSQGDFLTADPHAQNEGINNLINCWHQMRRRYPRLDLSAPRPKWFPSMQAIADSRRTLD